MPSRMDVSDNSDEEDDVPTSKSRAQQGPTSRGEIPSETTQEQAIDENQMINEEYKIWCVLYAVFGNEQRVTECRQEEKRAVSLRYRYYARVGLANVDVPVVSGQRGVRCSSKHVRRRHHIDLLLIARQITRPSATIVYYLELTPLDKLQTMYR
jgi:hypothetical protein